MGHHRAGLLALLMLLLQVSPILGGGPGAERQQAIRFHRADVQAQELRRDPEAQIVLLQFREVLSAEDRRRLGSHGVKLLAYMPHNAYWVRLLHGASSINSIEAGGGIVGWGVPPPEAKLSIALTATDLSRIGKILVNLTLFPEANEEQTLLGIQRIDPSARLRQSSRGVFRAALRGADLRAVADLGTVQWIEPAVQSFTLDNADSAVLINAATLHQAPPWLSGAGINVAVFDSCYPDLDHADFGGRVSIARLAQWCVDQGLFNQSHPTHVTGTVVSSGINDPAAKGMAPAAIAHSYTFALYHYDDLVADFDNLNVRLSNHSYSWGSYPYGAYEQDASTLDSISQQTDVAMFWSSGNDGYPQEWGGFTPGGWTSQRNGGLAKNSFSVCALTGTYVGNFMLKLDSSRGPTLDGRIKPEFCALGGGVYSLEPGTACGTPPCYGNKDGTSQASPALAGGSALLYELYANFYGATLPLDLLRAVLIHSSIDLHENNSGRWNNGLIPSDATVGPDYVTGWGLPDFDAAADLLLGGASSTGRVGNGQVEQREIGVVGDQSLKVTLAWVDGPGTPGAAVALVNDLDLEVEAPDGTVHYPWVLDKDNPTISAIRGVNVVDVAEQVVVAAPAQGTWKIRVRGTNLPGGAVMHDYALVVTGVTPADLVTPGEASAISVGKTGTSGEIAVSWGAPACMSTDNSIVFGPLESVSTFGYSGQVCSIGNVGTYSPFNPGAGSFFFLVVANDGSTHEGSYGTSSNGVERPEDTGCPMPQLLSLRCD